MIDLLGTSLSNREGTPAHSGDYADFISISGLSAETVTASAGKVVHLPQPRQPPFLSDMMPEKSLTSLPLMPAYLPV